ncbi:MAG: hypothetical protein WC679_00350 [Bacteroidales bacterium]|jgi:hypothetical protein
MILDKCTIAIIKGIHEKDDASFHFGSLGAFSYFLRNAKEAGVMTDEEKLTEFGIRCYNELNLKDLPNCWQSFWNKKEWEIE